MKNQYEVEILKETEFSSLTEFKGRIKFFLKMGYKIESFNTVIQNSSYSAKSVVLMIKEPKEPEKQKNKKVII